MLYRLAAVVLVLVTFVPDWDDFQNQECHQVDECE